MFGGWKSRNEGSSTIETALVVSAILLILAVLVYSFLVMYQKMVLTGAAEYIAQQGAVIWPDSKKSISNGAKKDDLGVTSLKELYYQLLDDSIFTGRKIKEKINIPVEVKQTKNYSKDSSQEEKLSKMISALYKELSKGILKPTFTDVEIDFSNVVIQRKITLTLTQRIKIPFGRVKELFNGSRYLTLTGTATAVVAEPAEYIRNIDFVTECVKRVGSLPGLTDKFDGLKNKLMR